jgi:hypothetical protein
VIQPLRYTPDSEHRYFCFSPEGDGLTFWATAEERDEYAFDEIRTYLDDNVWHEDVEGLFGGVVTHITEKTDILQAQGELDEDGYDQNGEGPFLEPDSTFCNYALQPLPAAPTDDELLGIDELRHSWNEQADAANSWDELGLDEILCFAQQQALARWGDRAESNTTDTMTTTPTDWKALCADMLSGWAKGDDIAGTMKRARIALALPAAPGEGE